MADRTFATLKVRPATGKGKALYVSGTIESIDARRLTIRYTSHNDWRGTSTEHVATIERRRVYSSSVDLDEIAALLTSTEPVA